MLHRDAHCMRSNMNLAETKQKNEFSCISTLSKSIHARRRAATDIHTCPFMQFGTYVLLATINCVPLLQASMKVTRYARMHALPALLLSAPPRCRQRNPSINLEPAQGKKTRWLPF